MPFVLATSFYDLQYSDIDGNNQTVDQYRNIGKKILFVNIASGSARVSQLAGLEQLQSQYANKLVIIGFPSNSFLHEPLSNEGIKNFCITNYNVSFKLASKAPVTGSEIQPVYKWLTDKLENDMISQHVDGDFQKYLVNEDGLLIGVFSPAIEPLDAKIIDAILQ